LSGAGDGDVLRRQGVDRRGSHTDWIYNDVVTGPTDGPFASSPSRITPRCRTGAALPERAGRPATWS
jgi:hypothetical protein